MWYRKIIMIIWFIYAEKIYQTWIQLNKLGGSKILSQNIMSNQIFKQKHEILPKMKGYLI